MQKETSTEQNPKPKINFQAIEAKQQETISRNWFYRHIRAVEYTSLAVSGVLGTTLSAMANTNMSAAVWTTFAAVVFFAFGIACWWQKYLWDQSTSKQVSFAPLKVEPPVPILMNSEKQNISSNYQSGGFTGVNQGTVNFNSSSASPLQPEKYLAPGNDPTPVAQKPAPQGFTTVFFGNTIVFTDRLPFVVMRQEGEDMFSIGKEADELWFSAKFFSKDGKIVCEVVKNRFYLNEKNMFRMEETSHRLTVYNDEARLVFDLAFLNPTSIKVSGTYFLRNGLPIDIQEQAQRLGKNVQIQEGWFGVSKAGAAGLVFDRNNLVIGQNTQ